MKKTFLNAKRTTSFGLLTSLLLPLIASSVAAQNGNNSDNKHKLKITVLENYEQGDCLYIGNVVLDIRYRLHRAEQGTISVEQTLDGQSFQHIQTYELDGRRGNVLVEVDAGECSKDLRLSIQAH